MYTPGWEEYDDRINGWTPLSGEWGLCAHVARSDSGTTVAELYARHGIGENNWSKWRRGVTTPLLSTAERVCEVLGFRYRIGQHKEVQDGTQQQAQG